MPAVINVVEDYVAQALSHAVFGRYDNGMLWATVPECVGIVASGESLTACTTDLIRRLERWTINYLAHGWELPVLEGIDLNTEEVRARARSHPPVPAIASGRVFESPEAFEAELDALDREDLSQGS